jgi:N-acetylmuramoyl-L-alanine amidase
VNIEPKLLSVNYKKGRAVAKPDVIVIHIQEGTMEGTDAEFSNPATQKSAHYGVSKAGEVWQWVQDEDTAWHAGKVVRPTAAIVQERAELNPNSYSFGIECEGFAADEPPAAQMGALAELVRLLAFRHDIPITPRHVLGHRQIRADKTCPGKIDVAAVIKQAGAGAEGVQTHLNEIERHVAAIRRLAR